MFEDLNVVGIGVMVRNSHGEIKAALSEIVPMPSSVVVLKTLAARRVVHFVQELGLHSSTFKGGLEISITAIYETVIYLNHLMVILLKTFCFQLVFSRTILSLVHLARQHVSSFFSKVSEIFYSSFSLDGVCSS